MATYAIGDIQGCYDELQALLALINYKPEQDQLWLAGDLVNRGPKSLEVLRFASQTPNIICVLGNHDLHLLALAHNLLAKHKSHTLDNILNAPDRDKLINWLRRQPLLYYDPYLNYTMTHAGLAPQWTLAQAQQYAEEVQAVLRSEHYPELLANMYGDYPDQWDNNLTGWERLRVIINYFTRMRFCDPEGRMDMHEKGSITKASAIKIPWFQVPSRVNKNINIIFGHWASLLRGNNNALNINPLAPHLYPLDGGCIWGGDLIAMRLEDRQFFNLSCALFKKIKS